MKPPTIKSQIPRDPDYWKDRHDNDIAFEHGCSPSHVWKLRKGWGMPKGPRKPGSGATPYLDTSLLDPTKTQMENAELLGCCSLWAGVLLRRTFGKKWVGGRRKKRKTNKRKVDWM